MSLTSLQLELFVADLDASINFYGSVLGFSMDERPGRGVEFVLWAEDLPKLYARVQDQGWPISAELQRQPWGLDDFRLVDPDGYYLRFTYRA